MKKLITILIMCVCCFVFGAKAQGYGNLKTKSEHLTVMSDSLLISYLNEINAKLSMSIPRFKMYRTENIHILLKLDTATGRVWMVQYGTGNGVGLSMSVDDTPLVYSWEAIQAGRFELYPTQNMYNFILLDTSKGHTYQVQWHTNESSRMRVRID